MIRKKKGVDNPYTKTKKMIVVIELKLARYVKKILCAAKVRKKDTAKTTKMEIVENM